MIGIGPDPEFLTIIGKDGCTGGPSKLRKVFQGFFWRMERDDVSQGFAPGKDLQDLSFLLR